MNLKSKDFLKIQISRILSLVGLIGLMIILIRLAPQEYSLYRYGEYTNGYIDSICGDWDFDRRVHYSFYANGKKYKSERGYNSKIRPKKGQRFKVKYSRENPDYNRMIIE